MKKRQALGVTLTAIGMVGLLGGCVYRTEKTVPAASPGTTTVVVTSPSRVVTYPEGQYELRGEGTAMAPYYWVWIPRGATAATIPAPPPLPGR